MTDEEKAEEYVSPKVWGDTYYINCCGDWSNEEMKKAYLDGMEEGRKEGYEQGKETLLEINEVLDSIDAKTQIKNLEKENAKLKEEFYQKSDTNHSLVEQLADKEIIISELKAQIEKMKNCQNCKYCNIVYDEETQTMYNCIFQKESECKWELSE